MKAKNKCRLTEILVKRLKATGSRPEFVWDDLCYGLVFVVQPQPSNHRTFRFFYCIAGKPRWIDLGWIYLDEARKIGFGLRADIAKGLDPWAERRKKVLQRNISFAELHERYLTEVAMKKNKAWKQPDRLIRRYMLPKLGKVEAASISKADVRSIFDKITAPILANQVLRAISAEFSWAIKQDIIVGANPAKGIERNPTTERARVLTPTEVALFWKEWERLDPIKCAALKCLLLLGQRSGEVCHWRREHIKDGWWEMPGEVIPKIWPGTKTKSAHRLWIPPEVWDIIDAFPKTNNGFVFGKAAGGLAGAMQLICERHGVERATPHDLRRTHGTAITSLGFTPKDMNRIQNHKEGGIHTVYDRHHYGPENKKIMERVARHIVALAEGREGDAVVVPFVRA
jgi:integrase